MDMKQGYKQSEVGVIPEDWEVRPLLRSVTIATGQVDPRKHPYCSMILVAPDHIESGTGRLLLRKTAAEQGAISGKYQFKPGDLVYSKIRPYLQKAIRVDFHGLCSADMYPLTPVDGVVPDFILPILLGNAFTNFATAVSVRSGIPKINRDELSEYVLPLPPETEQRAIAEALSDVDDLIAGLDRLIAKKRDIKQATMQQLLTGNTRLPGFSDKWLEKKLGDLGLFLKGKGIRRDQVLSDGFPCVRYGEIYTRHHDHIREFYSFIDPETASTSQPINRGDLLFTGSGETAEEIGKCVAYLGDGEAYAGGDIVILQPTGGDPKFLGYLMNSASIVEQKARAGQGDAVVHISATNLSKIRVLLPDEVEQEAIAKVLWEMDREISGLEAKRDKTRLIKQGMMQELLTGKTRLV